MARHPKASSRAGSNRSVTLILPAYNEAKTIGKTLEEAIAFFADRAIPLDIIVAVDGNDGTAEIVSALSRENPRLRLLHYPDRLGKGHAVREAVRCAEGDYIGFADADNKTPITEFPPFYEELNRGTALVIGSRAERGARIEKEPPLYRRLGSRAFNFGVQLFLKLDGIRDTQCGFKFFQREIARELFHAQRIDGYMFDVEILFLAKKRGYSIAQIPVRWRDDGDTRLELFRGNLRNAREILSIRFPALTPTRF